MNFLAWYAQRERKLEQKMRFSKLMKVGRSNASLYIRAWSMCVRRHGDLTLVFRRQVESYDMNPDTKQIIKSERSGKLTSE